MSENIAVIGGGMAGTAAAHSLVERGYDVTIIEQNDRLGGRVHSELVDGAAVEMGAGFMTNDYENVLTFMGARGLDSQLYVQAGSSGIWRDGEVRMVTPGALAGNRLLSLDAKLQAASLLLKTLTSWPWLDNHAFWKADKYDERSVTDMFQTKKGKEFLEYALQPILSGYFYWEPEHTSEAMLRILCKAAFSHGTHKMQGGLQRIPEAAASGSTVLLERVVRKVQSAESGGYEIVVQHRDKTHTIRADGVVCATPASAVSDIFPDLNQRQERFFDAIKYSSAALIARTYLKEQTLGDKAIAFPRHEGTDLAAVTLSPEPGVQGVRFATVKTYASGAVAPRLCKLSDKELVHSLVVASGPVHQAVLLGTPAPIVTHVQRWPEALPLFDVGHFSRLRAFENGEIEDSSQRIVFAGDYIGGPFMEGAFTSGIRAAERLAGRLS